jgi:hypothetical protein
MLTRMAFMGIGVVAACVCVGYVAVSLACLPLVLALTARDYWHEWR